jgi:hypothetical protein
MRSRYFVVAALLATVGLMATSAPAATFDLNNWAFNVDGTTYQTGDALPGAMFATGGFDFTTGLGVIGVKVTGMGNHSVDSFFDIDIDLTVNGFDNEFGIVVGAPGAGQSWEIDEPGFSFGDIFTHVMTGNLDNTNNVPITDPEDVSMALGWDFMVPADHYALLTLTLGTVEPTSGFYLQQVDPNSQASVFFRQNLEIRRVEEWVIPEPMTLAGCLMAFGAVARYVRKRRA